MKILVTKAVSNDEQLQATVEGRDVADIGPKLLETLELLDARNALVCGRVVDAMKMTEGLPPAVRQAINATMGVLYGRPGAMQEMAVAQEALAAAKAEEKYGSLKVVEPVAVVPETVPENV